MYYGLVKYQDVEHVIGICESVIAVCEDALTRCEPETLAYAQLLGHKRANEKILKQLKKIKPINIG